MTEVTDVIVARRLRPERFNSMLAWSVALHGVVVGLFLFGPLDWNVEADAPRSVMMVSLGGAQGPRQGMTPMAGRAVPPPVEKPAAVAPPPPEPPKQTIAEETRPPRRRVAPPTEEPPTPGATRTETGSRGQGFGLSTGGGGGAGVQLEVTDFCCPEYLQQMVALIQQNWMSQQGVAGTTVMRFTIARSGSIQGVQVFQPSGFVALDLAAQQALLRTRLPELPVQYPNPTLTMRVAFEYQR
ncbi:MAG: TonB C-terminal domain-containing protein [Acidimicrobiia bacterium]|nr:TonB C-terminal domain-containing protein [Acidimicrobiia bacterium]